MYNKIIIALLIITLPFFLFVGFKPTMPTTIEAKQIILRGENGKILLEITTENETPIVRLKDSQGRDRLQLTGGDQVAVVMKNPDNEVVAHIGAIADGGAALLIQDGKKKGKFQLQSGKHLGFFLINDAGKIAANMTVGEKGEPILIMCDRNEKPKLQLIGGECPTLSLLNKKTQTIAELKACEDEIGVLRFFEKEKGCRLQLQGGASPAFFMKGDNQQIIASLFALKEGGGAMTLSDSSGEIKTMIKGGDSPDISFFRHSSQPNLSLGISNKVPFFLMYPPSSKQGLMIHGGDPTSLLFVDERKGIPVILSKYGLYSGEENSKENKQKLFYSFEELRKENSKESIEELEHER